MPKCMMCKDTVTSGFVLCSHCAKKLEPYTLPTDLAYFIHQLAEDVVLDDKINQCSMCAIGHCTNQVSSLTCRNAVKAWLLTRAEQYFAHKAA